MALRNWIVAPLDTPLEVLATATVATSATEGCPDGPSVATVAGVAVAEAIDRAEAQYRDLCGHLRETVETPRGRGRLWQVFRDRVGVVIDGSVWFFDPDVVKAPGGKKDVSDS